MQPTVAPAPPDPLDTALPSWYRRPVAGGKSLPQRVTALAMALIWAAGAVWLWNAGIDPDNSWYLMAIRSWLFEGARLYVDIIEINPPLAFYVTAPPVVASALMPISSSVAFNLYVLLLAALSSALVLSLVRRSADCPANLAVAYALTAGFIAVFGALPQFGQREHFTVLFALPFVTMAAFRPLGLRLEGWQRAAIAAIACIGLFLKPHFLLAPLAISLVECRRERSAWPLFSPENWTIAVLACAYLLFVFAVHPEYIASVVPLARATYAAYAWPLQEKLPVYIGLAILAPAVVIFLGRKQAEATQRTAETLFAAGLGFLAAFVLQDRGWDYHRIPMKAFTALAGIAVLAILMQARPPATRRLCFAAAALLVGGFFASPGRPQNPYSDELQQRLGTALQGQRVMGFSIYIESFYPYVTAIGARWVLRYPCLWPLPAAIAQAKSADPSERRAAQDVLEKLRREVSDDLRRQAPLFVISERAFAPADIDYIAFLSEDAGFAAEWRRYRKVHAFGIFEIWRREPGGAT